MKRIGLLIWSGVCLPISLLAACAAAPTPLPSLPTASNTNLENTSAGIPADVYFLRDGQIWLLARDGQTQRQITRETKSIERFDVSPVDGTLVYVADNSLLLAGRNGENHRVLVTGSKLPPVEDELAALNDRTMIAGRIAAPKWSPDGSQIAYIQNGLNVISVQDGQVKVLHPNDSIPEKGEASGRLVIGSVLSWSPDGQQLLVKVYYYPVTSIYDQKAALKTVDGYLTGMGECSSCTSAWSPNSRFFYLGNPLLGRSDSLMRCSAAEKQCTMIGQYEPARKAYYYTYPYVTDLEEVFVFMGSAPDNGAPPEAYQLYKMNSDGNGTTALRSDKYALSEALWAVDGSGVLIVTAAASGEIPAGRMLWLPADSSPAVDLAVDSVKNICWGARGSK